MNKRSVRLKGHPTSVSLEDLFWNELKAIAVRRKMPLASLIEEVDEGRDNPNLSSALRQFVFRDLRNRTLGEEAASAGADAGEITRVDYQQSNAA